jgi:hypothetical protein
VRLVRVFPRRTKASPDDALAYFGPPDLFVEADEVHVSVAFTWDQDRAEQLAEQWSRIAPVKIGGVGWRRGIYPHGDPGAEFIPGRYIKHGYTFTSRGCPRKCTFCSVPLRDPKPRLLPIQDGWNILDDNVLATPRAHVEAVFEMLRRQRRRVGFTGGLEARSLKDYQVDLLASLTPRPEMFWAYDPQDTFEVLESAARRLLAAGFTARSRRLRCYVLIGYPAAIADDHEDDTFEKAEHRLRQMVALGFTPMAMLYRPEDAQTWEPDHKWRALQRRWARPAIIHARANSEGDTP